VRWIVYVLILGAITSVGFAVPRFQKARSAPYYVLRRNALRQASNLVLLAVGLVVLAGALVIFGSGLISTIPTPTKAAPPIGMATPEETQPPLPSPAPTVTPVGLPTATPFVPGTITSVIPVPPPPPDATVTSPLDEPPGLPTEAPQETPAQAPTVPSPPPGLVVEGALVKLQAVAIEKDDQSLPVNPGTEFPAGDHPVYVFFTYEGLENGVTRTLAWYKDGELMERCSDSGPWQWGGRGRTWIYCGPGGGWEPGSYEVRVSVESKLQGTISFVILDA
jgi:hypothetical protein